MLFRSREYETVNADPTAIEFSWDFETVPEYVEKAGYKPTAYVAIDSTKVEPAKLKTLEDTLYGTEESSTLPIVSWSRICLFSNDNSLASPFLIFNEYISAGCDID